MNYNTQASKKNNIKAYYFLLVLAFIFTSCETSSLSELSTVEEDEEDVIEVVTYENRAQEILNTACVECHNANQQNGGVRLDTYEFAFLEADNGRMLSRMTNTSSPMPPSGNLPNSIIDDIVNWVDNGILEN